MKMDGTISNHISDPTNNNGSNGDANSKRVSDDSKNNEISNSFSKEKEEEEKAFPRTEYLAKFSKIL
jgi:hypothetical protein